MPVDDPAVGAPIFSALSRIENGFEGLTKPPDAMDNF
jgi:hypothetical protein